MKVLLLHKTKRFDLDEELPGNEKELTKDLGLDVLFGAMASGDEFLLNVCSKTIISSLNNDAETIAYRQEVLKDCLENPDVIKSLYALTIEALERKKESWYGIFSKYPPSVLTSSIGMMHIYIEILKKLRILAEEHQTQFRSEGFVHFFKMLVTELDDAYFEKILNHLKALRFKYGILISGQLTKGNKGANYKLVKPPEETGSWWTRLFPKKTSNYTFKIHPQDNSGISALSELRNRGINEVANILAQSNDHIFGFLITLRAELGFYLGCMNLHVILSKLEAPISFPTVLPGNNGTYSFKELYDISLSLSMDKKLVGNTLHANTINLVIITGANQGGKTTFLRSIGLAQMMMQAGVFVPAESLSSNTCTSIFTHFRRREDSTMESGKLDEELNRMDRIIKDITPNSMVLFNESFASTNEREGSEIAKQIVQALLEKDMKVFFVTHLYEFANTFYLKGKGNNIFLRADRKQDGTRTFKLIEGEPLQTSYGIDLYNRIFKN